MQSIIRVTSEVIQCRTLPAKGWLVLEKDIYSEEKEAKTSGGIIMIKDIQDQVDRLSGTGIIKKTSLFLAPSPYENYLRDMFREGDRVGFNNNVPYMSPIPAFWVVENPNNKKDETITMAVADVFCFLTDNDEETERLIKRIQEVNNKWEARLFP